MGNIILCDIDGTVADNSHRQHFLQGKKDWEGFFSTLVEDKPIMPTIELLKDEFKKGREIIFITGRPKRYSYSTNLWLKEYFNFNYKLYMREDGDQRNKLSVKKDIFEKNLEAKDIAYCLDNDPNLIVQWQKLGLKTIDVNKLL